MASMKKSKKDRDLKNDGFIKKTGGVNYGAISDKRIDDKRHEREKSHMHTPSAALHTSSTVDALHRMASGVEGRTLADKIADPNRPTWEQYKKDNEDKLDNVGGELKKMAQYRAQLDREREERLRGGEERSRQRKREQDCVDSDSETDSENRSSRKKRRKEEKKHKKKKKSKHKKHKSGGSDGSRSD